MTTTPALLISLSDPTSLLGAVQSSLSRNAIRIWLDRTLVDPRLVAALQAAGQEALPVLAHMLIPGRPPVIRYFLERDIPDGGLVHVECAPYQADVYVKRGLMPQGMADELASHSTAWMRDFPL